MKNILITGSIAYDNIMFFDGEFKDSIILKNIDHLSISFLAKSRKTFFGGCAPNIAYTLSLLQEKPLIVGIAGYDFTEYEKWLSKNKISTKNIIIDQNNPTAAAYILDDKNQNQITIFSPGSMNNLKVCKDLKHCDLQKIDLAIISPDLPDRMISMAKDLKKNNIPYIFDPGQALSSLSKKDLIFIANGAKGIIANEYETSLLEKILRMPIEKIADLTLFFVVTLGEKGCIYYHKNIRKKIPAIKGLKIKDVTGCGDAFRSGFLHAYVHDKSLEDCCKIANTVASFVIETIGTQNHKFTYSEFIFRLKEFY